MPRRSSEAPSLQRSALDCQVEPFVAWVDGELTAAGDGIRGNSLKGAMRTIISPSRPSRRPMATTPFGLARTPSRRASSYPERRDTAPVVIAIHEYTGTNTSMRRLPMLEMLIRDGLAPAMCISRDARRRQTAQSPQGALLGGVVRLCAPTTVSAGRASAANVSSPLPAWRCATRDRPQSRIPRPQRRSSFQRAGRPTRSCPGRPR